MSKVWKNCDLPKVTVLSKEKVESCINEGAASNGMHITTYCAIHNLKEPSKEEIEASNASIMEATKEYERQFNLLSKEEKLVVFSELFGGQVPFKYVLA
jgi:hypothetical protein